VLFEQTVVLNTGGKVKLEDLPEHLTSPPLVSAGDEFFNVHLADMPAWILIPKVHQLDPDIPIIAVTADDSWETSRRVRVEGGPVFFYGLKPLNLREMQKVVGCAMDWRKKHGGDSREGRKSQPRI